MEIRSDYVPGKEKRRVVVPERGREWQKEVEEESWPLPKIMARFCCAAREKKRT